MVMISLAVMLSGRSRVFLLFGKAFSGVGSLKVCVKRPCPSGASYAQEVIDVAEEFE
jgi:hypothetical protein